MEEYSHLSHEITNSFDKYTKKKYGIFITPKSIIEVLFKNIHKYMKNIHTILEPSCASCELIQYIDKNYKNKIITGIELKTEIFEKIKDLTFTNEVKLINGDYLTTNNDSNYDLIVGNPPYFVMSKTNVNKDFHQYFEGRPNIFVLFIIHSLYKLNNNGIIAFVLPKNFLNCLYYDKLRQHIDQKFTILNIIDTSENDFLETQQSTMVFIVQNKKPKNNNKWVFEIEKYTIFNENVQLLKSYYKNYTTLDKLGFEIKVGNVVWNQVKDKLTDDSSKTFLIYSGNIENNKLIIPEFKNGEKKQYIHKEGKRGPLLIVNRGYGNGDYKFNYALIDPKTEYLCENHIISIVPKNEMIPSVLLKKYEQIISSFENTKTKEFIKLYFANNGINTMELQYVLPIY